MAKIFYWEMVFSPSLSEKRPAIKNQFQMKFSQINKTLLDYFNSKVAFKYFVLFYIFF